MKTKTSSPSVFANAVANAKPKSPKKDETCEVILTEKNYPNISEKLIKLQELRDLIKEKEGELAMIEHDVREIGKAKFIEKTKTEKIYPGSFRLKGEKGGCILFIPMDKYLSVSPEKAEIINQELGQGIVETETKFSFDPELLQKYEKEISDFILNSKKIADEDKPKIIIAEVKHIIAKGTIKKLHTLFGNAIETAVELIAPIFMIKKTNE